MHVYAHTYINNIYLFKYVRILINMQSLAITYNYNTYSLQTFYES